MKSTLQSRHFVNSVMVQGFNHPYAYGAPTIQASNIKISNLKLKSAVISWVRGNGQKCAVFVKNDSTNYYKR